MIEIKNLTKIYHNQNQDFVGLKNISATLPDKGMVFIGGESGNGKSTLLNILSGLDSYDKGQVLINGVDLNSLSDEEMFAYRANYSSTMFEDNNLIEDLNVLENIKLGADFNGKKISNESILKILEVLKIKDKINSKPKELSGGQRQRVCMARALIKDPKVFFVDEPSGHLDNENSKLVWSVLKKLSEDILVVAVSHDAAVIKQYADRVITLKDGEIVKDSNPIMGKSKSLKPVSFERFGRIGNKNLFKLAFANIKSRMFRSVVCVVLSIISLLMFSTCYILQSYDGYEIQANFTHESGLNYIGFSNDEKITNEEYAEIFDEMGKYEFYQNIETNLKIDVGSDSQAHNSKIDLARINSVIEMQNQISENENIFGQKILFGNYPAREKSSGIVISDFVADLILKYGAIVESSTYQTFEDYEDLTSVKIKFGDSFNYVTGVYKTNYKDYLDSNFNLKDDVDNQEFEYYYNNVYTVGHVKGGNDGFVNSMVNSYDSVSNVALTVSYKENELSLIDEKFTVDSNLVSANISIPYTVYNELFKPTTLLTSSDFSGEDLLINDLTLKSKNIEIAIENGQNIPYLVTSVNSSESEFKVSAAALRGSENLSYNTARYDGVVRDAVYQTKEVVVSTNRVEDLAKMIKIMDGIGYNYNSLSSEEIAEFTNKIETFSTALIVCAVITALFSVVLMYTFISNIIDDRRKENGLLLSLGATKGDVIKIFLITTLMIAATIFVGTSLMTGVMSLILNSRAVTGLAFNIFNIKGLSILYSFVLTLLVTGLAIIIPMVKFSKRKPIQIMKDAKIR